MTIVTDNSNGEQQRHRILLDATAGAMAGCLARFVIGPLDVVKIRFQVQLEPIAAVCQGSTQFTSKYTSVGQALVTIFREEGIQGLWRGTLPAQLLTIPYTAAQFVTHHYCKDTAKKRGLTVHPAWGPVVSLGSGAIAGAAGTVASYPFDLLRTTLAAQGEPKVYQGMIEAAQGIVKQQGILGLYRGMGVTILEIMPYAALSFGLYDGFKVVWDEARSKWRPHSTEVSQKERQVQNFMCGLVAGLMAKLGTHPLDVAKKRYQVAGLPRSLAYGARVDAQLAQQSVLGCMTSIYVKEGVRGLWKGALPSIIKAAPNAAITFTAYEAIVAWLLALTAANTAAST